METFFERLSRPCPYRVGTRLEIIGTMADDPCPMEIGVRGTVTGGTGAQVWVKWDNGRSLQLVLPEDYPIFRVVTEVEER